MTEAVDPSSRRAFFARRGTRGKPAQGSGFKVLGLLLRLVWRGCLFESRRALRGRGRHRRGEGRHQGDDGHAAGRRGVHRHRGHAAQGEACTRCARTRLIPVRAAGPCATALRSCAHERRTKCPCSACQIGPTVSYFQLTPHCAPRGVRRVILSCAVRFGPLAREPFARLAYLLAGVRWDAVLHWRTALAPRSCKRHGPCG
jgi:hypothetical protein